MSIPFSIFCTGFTFFWYFLHLSGKNFVYFLTIHFLEETHFLSLPGITILFSYQFAQLLSSLLTFFDVSAKIFLTFFSQNDILYSSIERTFEYWRKEWSANHVESEVCGSRPSGQYLKYSDTGLFLSRKNSLTVVFTCKTDSLSDTSFNETSYWSEQ